MSENFNFHQLFQNLLAKLTEREQIVLKNRYHLTNELNKKSTLKKIGDLYNITRERVRQIEKEAVRKIKELAQEQEYADFLKNLEKECAEYIEKNGGLVREDVLVNDFIKPNFPLENWHSNAFLFVMEHLLDRTQRVLDHEYFYPIWKTDELNLDKVIDWLRQIEKELIEQKELLQHEQMLVLAKEKLVTELAGYFSLLQQKHGLQDTQKFLEAHLDATSKIEKNIINEWGLAHWENVQPKKLGDKIALIFKKENKPLHFREIAEAINQAKFDGKKICAATVHNELIANGEFVLIGRGLYANKNWGFVTGTVADIIRSIFAESEEPMTKEKIIEEVLRQRQVNRSTVYLTLINKNKFQKTPDGKFYLLK
ncbi:MAG: sigma factor-like helix-turn-helix DNA-binding protein [Patescibacteria group bacterium]